MEIKQEIMKKYKLFLRAKKLIIVFGIISTLFLTSFLGAQRYNLKILSIFFIVLSCISLGIFIITWVSIKYSKKHILGLIEEYEKIKL